MINNSPISNTINVEVLNKITITNKTYYKMKYFISSLEKNMIIKKKYNSYIIKNKTNNNKELLTEEYLDKLLFNIYKKKTIDKIKDTSNDKIIDKSKYDNNIDENMDTSEVYLMGFLFNALESGWSIRKKGNDYIFRKRHENKKEVYSDEYLSTFLRDNFNMNNLNQ